MRRFRDRFMRIESAAEFQALTEDFFSPLASGQHQGEAEHLTLFDRAAEGEADHSASPSA